MDIERLFLDKKYLEQEINFFTTKKHLRKIGHNPELVQSHLKKARHNLEFYKLNKEQVKFSDWLIVILYYSVKLCERPTTGHRPDGMTGRSPD